MQVIIDWLNGGRDYGKGVELYRKYGSSDFYKQLFAGRNDEDMKRKLADKLLALVEGCELQVVSCKTEVGSLKETLKVPDTPLPDKKRDNDHYLGLIKRKGELYTVLNLLMQRKLFLPDGEELRVCCVEILNTNQKLTECWAQIDYYQEHQCFPEEVKGERLKAKGEEMEPGKQAQYLRQSISKCRARLKSEGCKNREATQKLLDEQMAKLVLLSIKKKKTS